MSTEDVKPEDVLNFIKENKADLLSDNVILKNSDLTPEQLEAIKGATVVEETNIDTPSPQDFSDDVETINNHITFETRLPDLGKIEVGTVEKDLYIKSLLNDTPFELLQVPFDGMTILVRNRTLAEEDFIFACLQKEKDEGLFLGVEAYYTRLQQFLASFQIIRIADKMVNFGAATVKPTTSNFDSQYTKLTKHVDKYYKNISTIKWNAIVIAIRMFEAKLKLCNDNLRNENFWQAAGTN